MRILLIGGGGREHALAWAMRRSPRLEELWCAPGNAGIDGEAHGAALDVADHAAVVRFAKEKEISLVVVGPEQPLVDGLADALRAAGVRVFGPGKAAARLEGSKAFAKEFMKKHGIPTADFRVFTKADEALAWTDGGRPASFRVVKADGLAAGKGVFVCKDAAEVRAAVESVMVGRRFGAAGGAVVLEETLEGEELSVMALCDGKAVLPLVPSQDHKRVFDGDEGPNTGGMGAYAPVPHLAEAVWGDVEKKVFAPFLKGLQAEGLDYCGVIYFGLMITRSGPRVLEFNVRFGDPETQVVVPLIENDWLELFSAAVDGRLSEYAVERSAQSAVCVVMAAKGYPGDYAKGVPLRRLEEAEQGKGVLVFHAGTARAGHEVVSAGGRVLGVTALGKDFAEARARAYAAAEKIDFAGAHFRKDIGAKAAGRA